VDSERVRRLRGVCSSATPADKDQSTHNLVSVQQHFSLIFRKWTDPQPLPKNFPKRCVTKLFQRSCHKVIPKLMSHYLSTVDCQKLEKSILSSSTST
jgi:hypothetical protein